MVNMPKKNKPFTFLTTENLSKLPCSHECKYLTYSDLSSYQASKTGIFAQIARIDQAFAHSSRVFAPLLFPGGLPIGPAPGGVLNQSKSSIILKKALFSICLLKKWVAALLICLYMPEVTSVT